jgi:glucose-1-phosphate adenylyltransferase
VLSGDQLYRMDLMDLFQWHLESAADVTIAALPVAREKATGLGILQVDDTGRIVHFAEKPKPQDDISRMQLPREMAAEAGLAGTEERYLASMGIYVFTMSALRKALDNRLADFGSQVIPVASDTLKVSAYLFDGYWEDIGTIRSFYEANLHLTSINPEFNLYLEEAPIFTHQRNLPPSKINFSTISQSLASEGSIITNATISNCIVGIRTIIETGATLDGVVCMGADWYQTAAQKEADRNAGVPPIGIGRGCIIKQAIIDKNARIGDGVRITPKPPGTFEDHPFYFVRDGVVVIPKNYAVPAGAQI